MSLAADIQTVRRVLLAAEALEALDRIETALVISVEAALMVARATTREDS